MRSLALVAILLLGIGYAGNTLTVTTSVPGLFSVAYEHVFSEGYGFEFSYGARLTIDSQTEEFLSGTPYIVGSYYGETYSWWVEVSTPSGLAPYLGDEPYWLRSGIQYRW